MTDPKTFWSGEFAASYRDRNARFDTDKLQRAWASMLRLAPREPERILECGSNIGRNLGALRALYPKTKLSLIELAKETFDIAVERHKPEFAHQGLILDSRFPEQSFDLVFTVGVLIHVMPYDLYRNIEKMVRYSRSHVLICEYFSRTLDEVVYHGQRNKLFKMDFGKFALQNFDLELVDYGFLWGYEYDEAGMDDITWWLMRKK